MNTLNNIQQQRIARSEALLMVHVERMRKAGMATRIMQFILRTK